MRPSDRSFIPPSLLSAQALVDVQEPLDRQLSPLGLRAIEVLSPRLGEMIVDIGCGTGQTVLQLAGAVGSAGRVLGVDIAALVLDAARQRAMQCDNVAFVETDASSLSLSDASADAFFSRFGVMALQNPAEAFSSFHRILKPTGRVVFVCWRSLRENELDLLPLTAAGLEHMADPTPFRFEDPNYVRGMLNHAGYQDIAVQAYDTIVTSGDLDAMVSVLMRVGPLGRIMRENPDLRADAEARVRRALAVRGDPRRVALNAATWIVSAEA